jgi:hypothetical protein
MNKEVSNPVGQSFDDEISISEIFQFLYSAKTKIVISVVTLFVVYACLLSFKYLSISQSTHSQIIYFKFTGVEKSKLPNGDEFRVNDIISPSVFSEVIKNLKIEEYTNIAELSNIVNIRQFSQSRGFIIDKYSYILDNKNSSASVISEARKSMETELDSSQKRAAILTIITPLEFNQEKAKNILREIPKVWARQAIKIKGAGHIGLQIISSSVISEDLEVENSVDTFKRSWATLITLQKQLQDALGMNIVNYVRDDQTKYTLQDAVHLLNLIEQRLVASPLHWDRESRKGQKLNVSLYSPALFDHSMIKGLDYLVAIDLVKQRISLVKENVAVLLRNSGSYLAVDLKTGLTLEDINKLSQDLDKYELQNIQAPLLQLGISKNPDRVEMYFTFRLNNLKRELNEIQSIISTLEEAEVRYLSGNIAGSGTQSQAGSAQKNPIGATMIPQFGDDFIDKVIALSQKSDDVGFRQGLNSQVIDLSKKSVLITSKISQIREYLKLFKASNIGSLSNFDVEKKEKFESETESLIIDALNKTKLYAEATNNIARSLRFSESIYNTVENSVFKPSGNGYYLEHKAPSDSHNIQAINQDLSDISTLASNIFEKASNQFVGEQDYLFSYSGEVSKLHIPLVARRDIMILILLIFFGGFAGLIWQFIRNQRTKINNHF